MRMSKLFGHTLHESPADAELTSHRLALRASLIRALGAGLYTYLPLGYRVVQRIETILREEMDAIGAQEMLMPVLHPAELWKATGRWQSTGPALVRVEDRSGREYALAMTHEEVVAELARREILSYRDLPSLIYHIQTKLRDEPRPRGGLLRVREFRMKDAYSMHTDAEDLDRFYPSILEAYERIFDRCGLDVVKVEADTGIMGGADSHEFLLPSGAGEDEVIHCTSCGYAANAERAEIQLTEEISEDLEEPEPVATPGCATIADVADFVGVPTDQTMKVVFYAWTPLEGEEDVVFVVIRGDLDVNETKLLNLLGGGELRAATDEEVSATGAEPGYASPVGMKVRSEIDGDGILVIGDPSIQTRANMVAGANREGYHLTGVNYPRDFTVTALTDVAQAQAGHPCPRCGGVLESEQAIELGHCFKLGVRYSDPVGVTYLDPNGEEQLVVMGSYGIGVGRLLAAVIEAYHDEDGIVWPPSLAPYDVHLLSLGESDEVQQAAERAYELLHEAGLEVLYDDRSESAGSKFADADLIGCPVRALVSGRSLGKGGLELKARWSDDSEVVAMDDLPDAVANMLSSWEAAG